MRILLLAVAIPAFAANNYYTIFPLTENPISEAGAWTNGAQAPANLWTNMRTVPANAFGTEANFSGNFDDSVALLTGVGAWGATQTVMGVIHAVGSATDLEIELRLRSNFATNSANGYEIDISLGFLTIVRWNGPLNNFTGLTTPTGGVANGDVIKATISGGNPTVITVFKNGSQVLTYSDSSPILTGNPGIGWFAGSTGDPTKSDLGLSSFWATDGGPIMQTTTANSITSSGASTGGTVVDNGGSAITSEGVCYATSAAPTSPCTSNGTSTPFTSTLSGLSSGTLYHYRSFGTTALGTNYGPESTFTTSASISGGSVMTGKLTVSGKVVRQ